MYLTWLITGWLEESMNNQTISMRTVIKCSKFLHMYDIITQGNNVSITYAYSLYFLGIVFIQPILLDSKYHVYLYVTKKFEFYPKIKGKSSKGFK